MIHKIQNRELKIIMKNEIIELPIELQNKIDKNFENMKKNGANIWNGEVLCVSDCNIDDNSIEITCKKTDYAHYLYEERVGCAKEYECKNLSAGCLFETSDGYYVIGELDEKTSYPRMMQVPGGGIDKADIFGEKIEVENTIKRETKEEININLDDNDKILENKLSYIYITNENEQPGVEIFQKVKLKMNSVELNEHFKEYYQYLKQNSLELELRKLHFLKKENALEALNKLDNPKRDYFFPLIEADLKGE